MARQQARFDYWSTNAKAHNWLMLQLRLVFGFHIISTLSAAFTYLEFSTWIYILFKSPTTIWFRSASFARSISLAVSRRHWLVPPPRHAATMQIPRRYAAIESRWKDRAFHLPEYHASWEMGFSFRIIVFIADWFISRYPAQPIPLAELVYQAVACKASFITSLYLAKFRCRWSKFSGFWDTLLIYLRDMIFAWYALWYFCY